MLVVAVSALITPSPPLSSCAVWLYATNEPKSDVFCARSCLLPRGRLGAPGPACVTSHISDNVPSTNGRGSRGTATTNDDVPSPAVHPWWLHTDALWGS